MIQLVDKVTRRKTWAAPDEADALVNSGRYRYVCRNGRLITRDTYRHRMMKTQ